jgi:hypothetical protein
MRTSLLWVVKLLCVTSQKSEGLVYWSDSENEVIGFNEGGAVMNERHLSNDGLCPPLPPQVFGLQSGTSTHPTVT